MPDDIRHCLFRTLFSRVSNIVMLMFGPIIVGTATLLRSGNVAMEAAAAFDVVLLLARCILIVRYQRLQHTGTTGSPTPWIVLFGLIAIGSSACWGVLCLCSLAWGHDPVLYLLPVVTTCAMAVAMATRSSAFPRMAVIQMTVNLAPTTLGSAFTNDAGNALLMLIVPLLYAGLARMVVERNAQLLSLMLAQRELERLAQTDALTGLANRRRFDEVLAAAWQQAIRNDSLLSLLLLDVDCFKQYNDNYGHQQGDKVLVSIADELHRLSPPNGAIAARQGGEEFAVILPDVEAQEAGEIANQVRRAVQARGIEHHMNAAGVVTVSVGIACIRPDRLQTLAELFQAADQALYHAKSNGRNRTEIHFAYGVDAMPDAKFSKLLINPVLQ
ncbi:MAG: GGDEF domain-containing protein [Janthinobacterium lividum]